MSGKRITGLTVATTITPASDEVVIDRDGFDEAKSITVGAFFEQTFTIGNDVVVPELAVSTTLSVPDCFLATVTGGPAKIGFFGQTEAVRQTVTGAKGGNAALASLLAALADYGIIIDNSGA